MQRRPNAARVPPPAVDVREWSTAGRSAPPEEGFAGRPTYPLDLHGALCRAGWEGFVSNEDGFLGASESPSAGEAVRLWFGSEDARTRIAAKFHPLLRSLTGAAGTRGPDAPGGALRHLPPEPPRDWTAPYREFFRGVRAGGFFVHPPHVLPEPGLRSLVLTPGPAFGTGMHPTTRMVLESLEEHLRSRRSRTRVLDLGTGSGILAVAAALLGAGPVAALDRDPLAIRAAADTAARNHVAGTIRFREGDYRDPALAAELRALAPAGFDMILANLSADALADLWGFAEPRLRPGGRILLSGFLRSEAARVLASFPRERLRTAEIRLELPESPETDTWAAAVLERRAPPADRSRAAVWG